MVYYQSRLDATFAALSDPTRRALIARLASGERTIGELAGRFDMSLPAVSKHIRVLERAGLATIRRDGRVRRTTLTAKPMREAMSWMERYRRFWESQFDQLAAYLEDTTNQETAPWQPPPPAPPRRRSKSVAPSRPRGSASSTRGRGRKK